MFVMSVEGALQGNINNPVCIMITNREHKDRSLYASWLTHKLQSGLLYTK